MKQRYLSFFLCGALVFHFSCVKNEDDGENRALVSVGSSVLRQSDFNAYTGVINGHPTVPPEFALAKRLPATGFIECASIFSEQRFNPATLKYRFSHDWRWKKRYMIAVNFIADVLQRHLGYSEKELKKYYKKNRSDFMSSVLYDSAGTTCTTTVITPFEGNVKRQIAEKLFLRDYQPDSAFLANTPPLNDENVIRGRWIKYMRNEGYEEFFLEKFFKDKYGTSCPDSYDELVGKGRVLSQKDIDVLLAWLSEPRRKTAGTSRKALNDFTKLVTRWLIFSERAKATGYASQPKIRAMLRWLWRLEVAQRHISNTIGPVIKERVSLDTAMALYSYWDEFGNPGRITDTVKMNDYFEQLLNRKVMDRYTARLDTIRRNATVTFFTDRWSDGKDADPTELLRRADSLRKNGSTGDAQTIYRTLVNEFVYTPQGREACVKLAEIQTEKQFYSEAVRNYRRACIHDSDLNGRCNLMFVIGFIYDEYLNRPDMAEVNYKWILKNTPDCDYADDAEFGMLHLDEKTESVEEVQAEVRRQGKKVETSSADSTALFYYSDTGAL